MSRYKTNKINNSVLSKPLSPNAKEKLLSKLFWDLNVDVEQLDKLLTGEVKRAGAIEAVDLYYRLLTTFDWHTLIKIVPRDRLLQMLSDAVIGKIKSEDLRERFRYARRFLST